MKELIVDNFAGGGGASTGIEMAGFSVDIAVNHDPEALGIHEMNHPGTKHFCENVWDVDPFVATQGQPVGLAWFSPDCKHFSKAKGGKPVEKKIRSLAWVVIRWAKAVRPRVIVLENVEEFETWGPLTAENKPCPIGRGKTFRAWKSQLERLGYEVDYKILRASDYGAPTIRKRLFLVARCDGQPIIWPEPTHGDPKRNPLMVKTGILKPWRTAAEIIDWSLPCPSIFERKTPLADATCRRIAKGIMRYVVNSPDPFIVRIGQTGENGAYSYPVDSPLTTIVSKAEHLLISPTLVQTGYGEREGQAPRVPGLDKPLGTAVAGGQKHALVTAFLAKHYGGVVGHGVEQPIGTITTSDHHSLVTVHIQRDFSQSVGSSANDPLGTITAGGSGKAALVTSNLVKFRGANVGQSTDDPLHTVTSQGTHFAEVRSFLIKYYGNEKEGLSLSDSLHTVTSKDRFGLVTVHGVDYQIADIGLRMLSPRELFRAQGFPDDYIIDQLPDGKHLGKTAQVRLCGNSVCPPLAQVIVQANYSISEIAIEERTA
jgi:DNA (cytosine-5)-methyltransferase 1